jgi:hypothetical protein
MDDSLSHWLRLREPFDTTARSDVLARAVASTMPHDQPLYAVDLASGTGANIRYLAERLHGQQRWLAVDRDAALLGELLDRTCAWGVARGFDVRLDATSCLVRGATIECRIETRQADLRALDERAIFAGRQLVTASALLDLVSESWLEALVARCRAEGAAALFSITYDGRSSCTPKDPVDDFVRELFNRHQKTDKGLGGPAAGPDAVDAVERCYSDAGFSVRREASDWIVPPSAREFQRLLVDGWAHAAAEVAPVLAVPIRDWHARRVAHINDGRSRVEVGHADVAAWPPGARS